MPKQYKQKFLVPGDTIRDCWYFRKKCQKQYPSGRPPCRVTSDWRRDETKCPFPVNKPDEYIVAETEDGYWECSCPAWKFRRIECHHIRKAKANQGKYRIAKEFTGRTTDVLSKIFQS